MSTADNCSKSVGSIPVRLENYRLFLLLSDLVLVMVLVENLALVRIELVDKFLTEQQSNELKIIHGMGKPLQRSVESYPTMAKFLTRTKTRTSSRTMG